PFESVDSGTPRIISPTAAVVVTCLYYYAGYFLKENEYYLQTKADEKQRFELLRTRLCEHLRYAISLHDFVKNSQDRFSGAGLDMKDLNSTLWSMRQREIDGKSNPFVVTPSTNPKSQYSSN